MARRKPPPSRSQASDSTAEHSPSETKPVGKQTDGGESNSDTTPTFQSPADSPLPSPLVRNILGVFAVAHLVALFVSYSAIIEPSALQSSLLDTLAPYLRGTHFAADGRRFYLAHATPDEQPHRLQVASTKPRVPLTIDSQTEWTTVDPSGIPGLAAWDRYNKWMTLAATLSESDQRSLAAALLMPLIRADKTIGAVRIVRLPTQLTTAEQDAAGPAYLARVVRDGEQINLVSIESQRLTTSPRTEREAAQ
ncbi:hypothetical protein [Rhodopirellula sp. MGV]|uniref:hypothetical protein n=1 Tax=Rhodopirellula sp. MGV TaxID=2023130 RepID=UPI00117B4E66|nr:hypothetical protein [Rhodopirellula sp. MGV]